MHTEITPRSILRLEQRRQFKIDQAEMERLKHSDPEHYRSRFERYFAHSFEEARLALFELLKSDAPLAQHLCTVLEERKKSEILPFCCFPFFKTKDSQDSDVGIAFDLRIVLSRIPEDGLAEALTIITGRYSHEKFHPELIVDVADLTKELEFMADVDYMLDKIYDTFGEPAE